MIFTLIESKDEIQKAQQKLEATIRREFRRRAVRDIGYPGGREREAEVRTDGRYWYWSSNYAGTGISNPRNLNWFGLYREAAGLQISVEINVPYKKLSGQVAGFFARDTDTQFVYLVHSGRVGGGTIGVGKSTFLAWSDLKPVSIADSSGSIRYGVLVMPITGVAAVRSATRYVDTIARFKQAVRNGELKTREFKEKKLKLDDYFSEAQGRRTGKRSGTIDYVSRHGEVVDALYSWRIRTQGSLPKNARIVKNVLIDLGVAVSNNLLELYEVKTDTTRSELYCAIGQLLVHGTAGKCRRAIVLPHHKAITMDVKAALKRMSIQVMKYKMDKQTVKIL